MLVDDKDANRLLNDNLGDEGEMDLADGSDSDAGGRS